MVTELFTSVYYILLIRLMLQYPFESLTTLSCRCWGQQHMLFQQFSYPGLRIPQLCELLEAILPEGYLDCHRQRPKGASGAHSATELLQLRVCCEFLWS